MKSGLVQICSPDRETYQYDRKETVVDTKRKEGNYNHILYSLVIIVLWGLVPSLAKMGNLSGGLTTMYVNWFAVVGVFIIMLANGTIRELWRPQPYGQLVGIGFIWPLVYSILYFSSINRGSGSLTTIANYFWPVFYLICATLLYKKKFDGRNWLVVALAVAGVAVPVFLEANVQLVLLPAVLGLAAALCQALYSLLNRR